MKTRYLYFIPCLTLVCALSSCEDNKGDVLPKDGIGTESVGSVVVAPDLIAKRAERLGIAALFPKEMGMMAGVYDIPGIIKGVMNLNMVKEWGNVPFSFEMGSPECSDNSPVIDVMVGFGPEWSHWMKGAESTMEGLGQDNMKLIWNDALSWAEDADNKDVTCVVQGEAVEMMAKLAVLVDLRPSQSSTAPVMLAMKLTPDAVMQVKAVLKDIKLTEDLALHGLVSLYDKNYNGLECKVAELDCKSLRAQLEENLLKTDKVGFSQDSLNRLKGALTRLDGSKLYLALSFAGDNTLVAFITTNPEKQVRLAASAQDSVLARNDFSMADNHLGYPAYGLAFLDKASVEGVIGLDKAYYNGCLTAMQEKLQNLVTDWKMKDATSALSAMSAVKGIWLGWYDQIVKNASSFTYYSWQDRGVHLETCSYPVGLFKLDTPSALSGVRPTSDTILYQSCTIDPNAINQGSSLVENVTKVVWDYGNAFLANSDSNIDESTRMGFSVAIMVKPTIEELWKAYKIAISGMTGANVVTVDMKGTPSPVLQNIPAPRFSVVGEVKNRAALNEAWQKVATAARTIIPLVSQGEMSGLPEPEVTLDGDVTTYDYKCSSEIGLNPVVSVSDSRWAFSMPKDFGLEVLKDSMKSSAQGMPLEIQFNLIPLRNALKATVGDNDDVKDAVQALDIITADVKGVHVTGSKDVKNGKDVYHIHVISASK